MALMSGEAGCPGSQATVADAAQRCPFLRNIEKPTTFAFAPFQPSSPGLSRGPIFEDGPSFDAMFRLFHGREGIVPLAAEAGSSSGSSSRCEYEPSSVPSAIPIKYHPLAASAATISLSAFGGSGPFSFDSFMAHNKAKKVNKKRPSEKKNTSDSSRSSDSGKIHEAKGSEWLNTGNCPIAKSYRAVAGALPLVAKMIQLPSGVKYRCPPAIVAARAALAKTPAVKALKPQALPTKVLAIGALGIAVNIPLGVWREHTQKFSPAWFVAVHASVPFIAMLRKAVVMPKYAMAFTIAASILGQVIGSRAERIRVAAHKAALQGAVSTQTVGMGGSTRASEATLAAFTVAPEQVEKNSSSSSVAKEEPRLSLRAEPAQDGRSQSSKQDTYQESLGSDRGVLDSGFDDKFQKTAAGLDAWGPDLNRGIILHPWTCGHETWATQGSSSSIVPPAGAPVH